MIEAKFVLATAMGVVAALQPLAVQARPQTTASSDARADEVHRKYPAPLVPFDEAAPEPEPDDSLAQAIAEAYAGNPVLAARRYDLRSTDDALGIALSETRAQAQLQVFAGYDYTDPGRITARERFSNADIRRNDLGAQLIVDQPLSTGGKASANISAANSDIRAGREALRGSEGDLLVDLISAYADVRRDLRALHIREQGETLLRSTLDEVVARREAGELTRTDIAQAQAQLQSARVQLNAARAQLEQSRSVFTALVGREPGNLASEPPLPLVPASIDDAFDTADQFNPELGAAIQAERASGSRIAAARAEGRPTLALRGIAGSTGPLSPLRGYNEDLSLSARATLTIPLSAGGRVASQIGQALDRNSADRLRIEAARRQMVQSIVSAWNQIVTAARNEEVQRAQLDAARIFYEGTFEEYRAGLRSTFDVLYAQNGLRETVIALLGSRRDHYVAQASLLRQIGQLEAGKLITGNTLYDPSAHVRSVQRRGTLPWDGAVRSFDSLLGPGEHQEDVGLPAGSVAAPAIAPAQAPPDEMPLATRSPITPLPGTSGRPLQRKRP